VKKLILLCSAAAVMPTAAFAQSTGSETTESETIVVTGTRTPGVAGVVVPDVPKTRSVLTNEILMRQSAGQSVLQSINLIPGVNYTNTDPYGSSGGNLRIRGFPGNRVALLFDGLPLNDTGNYAIFGNQQTDQEIIDQVSVNLGTTDVDSPTPSAAGGVVSYRTKVPTTDFGIYGSGTIGDFNYHRLFGMVDSGEIGPLGTRGFLTYSDQNYDKFKGPGDLKKNQYNARVYQPIGSNGDFASIAVHFNKNRNNSYNNGLVSDYLNDPFFDNFGTCVRDTPTAGVVDNDNAGSNTNPLAPAGCTNYYNLRINPSNTGNIRGALKVTLMPNLVLTADPGYQHVLANGGGTTTVFENDTRLRGATPADSPGVDINGDGDVLDRVRVYQPSNTRTRRYTFLSSLIWEATEQHRFRAAYTFDRGRHRQTGEFGKVDLDGDPLSPFGGKYDNDARILTADGQTLQNRDRLSIAQLQQLSFEYFGRFFDDKLKVVVGVRAPWFKRELNQYCYTLVSSGNPVCTDEPILAARIIDPDEAIPAGPVPTGGYLFEPFDRTVRYSPLLPSAGVSYDFAGGHGVYASYGENFSSPSTDNLYRSVNIDVKPETTNSFELGYRFRGSRIQAQLATYYVSYKDRVVTALDLDPESQTFGSTLDRNVGDARAFGFDGQIAWRPAFDPSLSLYGYVSYIDSKLKEDLFATATATAVASPCPASVPVGQTCQVVSVHTKGKEFVETPRWQFGGRVQKEFGPISLGAQFKWVGKRWSTDDNGEAGTALTTGDLPISSRARTHSYALVDLDANIKLKEFGLAPATLRFSVTNLFDKYYFGNISTQNTIAGGPRFSVGAPQTFQAGLIIDY
jgi:iron complex outermembrane recepter protein